MTFKRLECQRKIEFTTHRPQTGSCSMPLRSQEKYQVFVRKQVTVFIGVSMGKGKAGQGEQLQVD